MDGRKPSAGARRWCQDIRKIEAKNVRQIRAFGATEGKPLIEPSVPAGPPPAQHRRWGRHAAESDRAHARAKKDAAEAVGEAAGVCRHNESQRWLDMRVGSPEDCCRDPPVVPQPPTSSATEESEGAPPLTAGLAAHRPTKHPLEHLYKYKYKGDLLQVVNAPGGSGKTLALATLLAEQEEIRSRSATWQLVEGLGRLDPPA